MFFLNMTKRVIYPILSPPKRHETLYLKSAFCHQDFNLPAKKRNKISMGASNTEKNPEKSKEEM